MKDRKILVEMTEGEFDLFKDFERVEDYSLLATALTDMIVELDKRLRAVADSYMSTGYPITKEMIQKLRAAEDALYKKGWSGND